MATSNPTTNHNDPVPIDLVGSPFAVIESDPGVFTNLIHRLGICNLEVAEMYDIDDHHLNPWGLIFCFRWRKDEHRQAEFEDPAAEKVWFANQLSDDACASLAILNVLLNCKDVDIGPQLREFRTETERMSPVMKGLAISNFTHIRDAHNALARPADIFGARNVLAKVVSDEIKAAERAASSSKRRKLNDGRKTTKATSSDDPQQDTFHFIGYLPAYGKVWELDGLKSGPLEVGELPPPIPGASERENISGWLDVVRPAIRMKMRKYGADAESGDIRFNLMAIVDDRYPTSSDALELLKREKAALEKRMSESDPNWQLKVDQHLRQSSEDAFSTRARPSSSSEPFTPDFGFTWQNRSIQIMDMKMEEELRSAWENCVRSAMSIKVDIEDMLSKDMRDNTDHIKRTHDYEPFLREYLTELHKMDALETMCKKPK